MRSALAALITAACSAPSTPAIHNASPAKVAAGFPCGAETLADLSPFEAPTCEPNGSCMRGVPRRAVGSCTVARSSSFDLYAGRERHTILEGGLAILSSDAPPYARKVLFDARLPSPEGIRVGMTGAELDRIDPRAEFECTLDDTAWRGHLLCKLRQKSECDDEDANWYLVVFDPAERSPQSVKGAAARALVRTRRILAVDLGPSCGED